MTKAARARGERLESGGTRHDRVKDDCAHAPAAAIAIALDVRRKNAPPHTPLAVRNLAESTRASAYAANGVRNSSQGACGPGSHIAPSPHGASNAAVGGAVDWKDAVAADQQGSRALRTQYLVIISGPNVGRPANSADVFALWLPGCAPSRARCCTSYEDGRQWPTRRLTSQKTVAPNRRSTLCRASGYDADEASNTWRPKPRWRSDFQHRHHPPTPQRALGDPPPPNIPIKFEGSSTLPNGVTEYLSGTLITVNMCFALVGADCSV